MESVSSYPDKAGEIFRGFIEITYNHLPIEMVLDGLNGYVACWTIGIIDLADSVHILVRTGKVLAARAVSRALIEAYAKLFWSLNASSDQTRMHRFLAIDQQWTTDFQAAYNLAISANISLSPSARINVEEQQKQIAQSMAKLGITRLPKVPSIPDIMKSIQEPVMYWSYRVLSDAVHPSSGLVNDVFNLSPSHLTFDGSKYPAKLAELMEIVTQVLVGTMRLVASYLSFQEAAYRESVSEVLAQATELMKEMVAIE